MRKILMRSSLVLLLALASCSSLRRQDPFMQIQPGMEAFQVQQILGDPRDRTFTGDHQNWFYRQEVGKDAVKTKVIVMEHDKVVALADDEVEAERQFELARARAAAPKIVEPFGYANAGSGPARGTSSGFMGGGLLCTDHNKYGDFAKGGGCNEYGCWSPGGSCNQHGCSATAECGEKECKDRVPSYQCVKR